MKKDNPNDTRNIVKIETDPNRDIKALQTIVTAFEGLNEDERYRTMAYLASRYSKYLPIQNY